MALKRRQNEATNKADQSSTKHAEISLLIERITKIAANTTDQQKNAAPVIEQTADRDRRKLQIAIEQKCKLQQFTDAGECGDALSGLPCCIWLQT